MKGNLEKPPKLGLVADSSDAKSVARLSTLLVATIEEAKDRISQIEYVFCSQLYPKVQLNYQSFLKFNSEAREAAESAYNEKEKDLLLQIENLQREKNQLSDENQSLKSEKEKYISMEKQSLFRFQELQQELKQKNMDMNEALEVHQNLQKEMEELEEKNCLLTKMQKKLEVENGELQLELSNKSVEVDVEKQLKRTLLQTNEFNASSMAQKEIQLREYEEKINGLVSQLRNKESDANEMLSFLKQKNEELRKGKESQENLLKKIDFQASEIMSNEQLFMKYEKEKKLLAAKVETLLSLVDELENELENRQNESFHSQRYRLGPALDALVKEKTHLLENEKNLLKKIDELHHCLSKRTEEFSLQIEAKDSELRKEKSKNDDFVAAYKSLKSQYKFLLRKCNLTEENMQSVPLDKMEIGIEGTENNASKATGISGEVTTPMDEEAEASEEKRRAVSIRRSSLVTPSTSKSTSSMKCCPPAGAKRPISYWRDTRSHQSRVGPDPHDDFLDTPLENVREYKGKIMEDPPEPAPTSMNLDNSDDETQDLNADAGPEKRRLSPEKAGSSGFKYVEPVRKKSDRENLKGVECKQCKKFYDAVLPDAVNGKKNMRCEHHDGVSRHRYKYAPPMTPEGFWNIGFESEM